MLPKLFLGLLTIFQFGTVCIGQVTGQTCDQPKLRKEIRELSAEEWNTYVDAIKKLHSGPAPTMYDKIVAIHLKNVAQAHNVPCFFPWHRRYIKEFELALQNINSSITLPYWDWSLDSQAPETSVIFSPEYYGASGESPCIDEGHFKDWQMYVPKPHCLRRRWNRGNKISALYPPELLSKIITGAKSYNEFRVAIEAAPHALVHVNIGGEIGDVGTMWSPNDPLFWSHHAFVDKIWADFQLINPLLARDYGGFNSVNISVSAEDEVIPFGATVASTFDIKSPEFCYSYSNPGIIAKKGQAKPANTVAPQSTEGSSVSETPTTLRRRHIRRGGYSYSVKPQTPPQEPSLNNTKSANEDCYLDADDRENAKLLRIPPPVPESWVKMNGYTVEQVRSFESEYTNFIAELNKDSNYISPASLERHDGVVSSLVDGTLDSLGLFDGLDQVPLLNLEEPLKLVDNVVDTAGDIIDGALSPILGEDIVNGILAPVTRSKNNDNKGLLGGIFNAVSGLTGKKSAHDTHEDSSLDSIELL